ILAQREGLELEGEVRSDTASLAPLVRTLLDLCPEVHAMRDPTRGGVAASLVEIAARQNLGIEIDASAIPVRTPVRGACELFGLDPLLVANEGKLLAFVPPEAADAALDAMRAHPLGRDAARSGGVPSEQPARVVGHTAVGGGAALGRPFGIDPLRVANEGELLAFVPPEAADAALDAMRAQPLGRDAARIGRVTNEHPGLVVVNTAVGGRRILDHPFAEQLPRIC